MSSSAPPLLDTAALRKTAGTIRRLWQLNCSFGWDFAMLAMNSLRLGDAEQAVEYLLHPIFQFDDAGNPVGGSRLPTPYFPNSGGLLRATAMDGRGLGRRREQGKGEGTAGSALIEGVGEGSEGGGACEGIMMEERGGQLPVVRVCAKIRGCKFVAQLVPVREYLVSAISRNIKPPTWMDEHFTIFCFHTTRPYHSLLTPPRDFVTP
ncbi:hypothetical protein VTK26DRAFT_383 [Humicola hyalothermophila]